nr:Mup1.1 [Starmerella bombicola]
MGTTYVGSGVDVERGSISSAAKAAHSNLGVVSAIFLIINRLIGTGIFATPGTIFTQAGSPGLALILWFVGTLISLAGLFVYMEFGFQIPKNGGEKNYLEYVFSKPRFLALATYCVYVFLLGWAASNSTAFGTYILTAAGIEPGRWNQRLIGLGCLTFSFLIHALIPNWALRLGNLLGFFKVVVILMIIIIGWVYWAGGGNIEPTHNLDHSFSGKTSGYGVVTALYSVIWSFIGYSNANYALGEAKDPEKILKYAAPIGFIAVAILYMLTNISYLGVVPLDRIKNSGIILAADFFEIVWGSKGKTALSVFVALSALGNVIVVIYGQARIVQELGRSSVLPFSSLWATMKPFHTPMFALFEHYIVSVIILLAPPPGDAYTFISNLITYPLSVVNAFVALALCIIYVRKSHYPEWKPKFKATLPVAIFFLLGNLYLIASPFVPPATAADNQYKDLPYWIHCVVGLGFFVVGALYWLVSFVIWPKLRGYELRTELYVDADGWDQQRLVKHRVNQEPLINYDLKIPWINRIGSWIEKKATWVEKKSEELEAYNKKVEQSIISRLKFWQRKKQTQGSIYPEITGNTSLGQSTKSGD